MREEKKSESWSFLPGRYFCVSDYHFCIATLKIFSVVKICLTVHSILQLFPGQRHPDSAEPEKHPLTFLDGAQAPSDALKRPVFSRRVKSPVPRIPNGYPLIRDFLSWSVPGTAHNILWTGSRGLPFLRPAAPCICSITQRLRQRFRREDSSWASRSFRELPPGLPPRRLRSWRGRKAGPDSTAGTARSKVAGLMGRADCLTRHPGCGKDRTFMV